MTDFSKKYNFKERELHWQKFWLEEKVYQWRDDKARKDTFVVDTPPPTVSGQLHIGHVYSYTHTDFIVRYKRMLGMDVFYPIGFDDNGLPTERLVEKKRNLKAASVERQKFIDICKEVVVPEEENFRKLFNNIALSVDWDQEYQTISQNSQKISQLSFLDLVKKGQVYRASEPILWDPVDQTALAQADIEDKERSSFMNDVEFATEDGDKIAIATTRPELLPACVAVFYHPDDDRYTHLAGKYAITPLFGIKVPLLPDDLVNPEKGTGLVMCCTFGDQTDILWWRKHKLPCKIIITKYGAIGEINFDENCLDKAVAGNFAAAIKGLKVKDARSKMIELLQENGQLIGQAEINQTVKCAERSGAPLEIITTPQWFVKTIDHRDALRKRSAELKWHPTSMKIKLDTWIDSVSWDWCISRQRFFGVPFPVWYSKRAGEEGKVIFASPDELPIDPLKSAPKGYKMHEVTPDLDVMDTWSTSSVSPQLNSWGVAKGYMLDEKRHKKLFPADLRPQAHEILRTWAFYTMLKAQLHEDTLPWKNIMISGWCLAEDRSKMSKSKGNIIVPEKLLEQFGSDVVRYWSANSKLGADTTYSEDVMNNGKRLVNKLWNAAKFVSHHFDKLEDQYKLKNIGALKSEICCEYDQYFLTQLQNISEQVKSEFEKYEYAHASMKLENFFWKDFCDNYLEISKTRAYNEDGSDSSGQKSAIITLYHSLRIILKMFAPIMPHITEEIYQILYRNSDESTRLLSDPASDNQVLGAYGAEDPSVSSIYEDLSTGTTKQLTAEVELCKRSIHARGSWEELVPFSFDKKTRDEAASVVEILELVRKAKANSNLSIKAPVDILEIRGISSLSPSLIRDLKNVTSTKIVAFVDEHTSDTPIEGDKLSIIVIYAEV